MPESKPRDRRDSPEALKSSTAKPKDHSPPHASASSSLKIQPTPKSRAHHLSDPSRQLAATTNASTLRRSSRIAAAGKDKVLDTGSEGANRTGPKKANSVNKRRWKSEPAETLEFNPLKDTKTTPPEQAAPIPSITQSRLSTYRDASTQFPEDKNPQFARLRPWLEALVPQESPPEQQDLEELYNMAETGITSNPSTAATKTPNTQILNKTNSRRQMQLRGSRVQLQANPQKDEVTGMLERAMTREKKLSSDQLNGLLNVLANCIEGAKNLSGDSQRYEFFETFRHELNKALPACQLFTLTSEDFERDRISCLESQEAFLQRTIMSHAMDRWRLPDSLVIDYEETWSIDEEYRLNAFKNKNDQQKIAGTNSKADLTVCFNFNEICAPGSEERKVYGMLDSSLLKCVHPSGNVLRCFPFLIMEVKKKKDTIEMAALDCLYGASQALNNIFSCMKKAGSLEEFDKVRVFSIAMNASDFEVRVHFGEWDQAARVWGYGHYLADTGKFPLRDRLHRVFRSILQDYASKELLGILQRTFQQMMRVFSYEAEEEEIAVRRFGPGILDQLRKAVSNGKDLAPPSAKPEKPQPDSNMNQDGRSQHSGDQHSGEVRKRRKLNPPSEPDAAVSGV